MPIVLPKLYVPSFLLTRICKLDWNNSFLLRILKNVEQTPSKVIPRPYWCGESWNEVLFVSLFISLFIRKCFRWTRYLISLTSTIMGDWSSHLVRLILRSGIPTSQSSIIAEKRKRPRPSRIPRASSRPRDLLLASQAVCPAPESCIEGRKRFSHNLSIWAHQSVSFVALFLSSFGSCIFWLFIPDYKINDELVTSTGSVSSLWKIDEDRMAILARAHPTSRIALVFPSCCNLLLLKN